MYIWNTLSCTDGNTIECTYGTHLSVHMERHCKCTYGQFVILIESQCTYGTHWVYIWNDIECTNGKH